MSLLYLHIGSPKTGTSAIQNFMVDNRKQLEKSGYCYPDFGKRFPGIGYKRNGHFLVYKIFDENKNNLVDKENELVAECLDKLSKLAKNYPNIVLSDEGIWHGSRKKPDFWNNLKKQLSDIGIELRIVVYLRRQDQFIQAFWAQIVKETSVVRFEDFIAKENYRKFILDYYTYLNHIAAAIGKENMDVRIYGEQKSIVTDFLECINLKITDKFKSIDKIVNTSLSGACLEVKRSLNKMPEFKQKASFIIPLLKVVQEELMAKEGYCKPQYFSYEDQQQFLKQYSEGNSAIAREYFNRPDGVLFKETKKEDAIKNHKKYGTDELIAVCGKIIVLQQKKINKNRLKNLLFNVVKKIKGR